jgi:cytochrome c biogenesis protein CcmG/thiol:disulfide interchange protein DsbE
MTTPATLARLPLRRLAIATAIVLPLAGLLALLGFGFTVEPRYVPSPMLGRRAPDFALELFDGGILKLADLRGRVVVVNFWASWCVPCREEARVLEAAWRRYAGPVTFVGVNTQDQEEPARAFLREFGISYPNGPDPAGRITIDYGVWGIPETFVLDPEGRITYKHVGAIDPRTLEAKLEEAARSVTSGAEGRGDYQPAR